MTAVLVDCQNVRWEVWSFFSFFSFLLIFFHSRHVLVSSSVLSFLIVYAVFLFSSRFLLFFFLSLFLIVSPFISHCPLTHPSSCPFPFKLPLPPTPTYLLFPFLSSSFFQPSPQAWGWKVRVKRTPDKREEESTPASIHLHGPLYLHILPPRAHLIMTSLTPTSKVPPLWSHRLHPRA